mmetsp:Transcript_52985/g.166459  ORF Transcript_52985/g.166459 Transcript_52985/m.166459 type:complete len:244 (+) Transcript_52985:1629-2360(+)
MALNWSAARRLRPGTPLLRMKASRLTPLTHSSTSLASRCAESKQAPWNKTTFGCLMCLRMRISLKMATSIDLHEESSWAPPSAPTLVIFTATGIPWNSPQTTRPNPPLPKTCWVLVFSSWASISHCSRFPISIICSRSSPSPITRGVAVVSGRDSKWLCRSDCTSHGERLQVRASRFSCSRESLNSASARRLLSLMICSSDSRWCFSMVRRPMAEMITTTTKRNSEDQASFPSGPTMTKAKNE